MILNIFELETGKIKTTCTKNTLFRIEDTEKKIYELIVKEGELNIDTICRSLEMPVSKLSALLLQMEFKGLVKCYPGNLYRTS